MSYMDYHGRKQVAGRDVDLRHQEQKELFRSSDLLFGVGPLLAEMCGHLGSKDASMIVPGFPPKLPPAKRVRRFSAISLGRFDPNSDPIKGGALAAAAFGRAIKLSESSRSSAITAVRPLLILVGVAEGSADTFRSRAEREAAHAVNVVALPFDESRDRLLGRLHDADAAMMLSWHEGFGLAGWEAIAAEVPLIISTESGLFRLISETLGGSGTGCLAPVAIRGGTDGAEAEQDINDVAEALIRIGSDRTMSVDNARQLRLLLVERLNCTWEGAARGFISALDKNGRVDSLTAGDPTSRSAQAGASNHAALEARALYSPVERYFSKDDFFLGCVRELELSETLKMTIVGPTFLEPDWWHSRCAAAEGGPDFTVAVRDRILGRSNSLSRCELILRNYAPRYVQNLREFVNTRAEWDQLIDEMLEGINSVFGAHGQTGPRIRCFDPGISHLPHIFDNAVLIGLRKAPKERVNGGWRMTQPELMAMERERWSALFSSNQQDQKQAIGKLRRFLASIRPRYEFGR